MSLPPPADGASAAPSLSAPPPAAAPAGAPAGAPGAGAPFASAAPSGFGAAADFAPPSDLGAPTGSAEPTGSNAAPAASAAPAAAPATPAGPAALHALVAHPLVKAALPAPAFVLLAPLLVVAFRKTWAKIDLEAQRERAAAAAGALDARPAVACLVAAFGLTLIEYYGGAGTYFAQVHPRVVALAERHPGLRPALFAELYNYVYWAASRFFVYVIVPFAVWKVAFRRDRLLDMGLRLGRLGEHARIYAACLAAVAPCVYLVARQPDFGAYYPFYRHAGRSWLDFAAWEGLYFLQFLGLEIFFRGWWLAAMRRAMGSAAIFSMVVPYCMIHYGKPYLEANGAAVAGIVLGTLAMKTRSIYAGLAVHVAVALGMDVAVLSVRGGLPHAWVPW